MNEKISGKGTVLFIVILAIVVIGSLTGAVYGHKAYLDKQEAVITNAAATESAVLRRCNGDVLVYRYEDGTTSVDLESVVEVSKGATWHVLRVIGEDGSVLSMDKSKTFSVENGAHFYVMTEVWSRSQNKKNGYVIEVVSADGYREDAVLPFDPDSQNNGVIIKPDVNALYW